MLNIVVRKLQEGLLFGKKSPVLEAEEMGLLPKDVKEGHFAVIAANDGKPKRFVVPLRLLGEPAFKALLERAAQEFGFGHKGALISIPCGSFELEHILSSTA